MPLVLRNYNFARSKSARRESKGNRGANRNRIAGRARIVQMNAGIRNDRIQNALLEYAVDEQIVIASRILCKNSSGCAASGRPFSYGKFKGAGGCYRDCLAYFIKISFISCCYTWGGSRQFK